LTSVNERQYQIPFCQVLSAEGETILYVSSHGPFEKGKDVITRTASGEIRAYQLKAGDVGLSEWRSIYGEITNLVELAIEFSGQPPITAFVPFLVTNGELTDPVLEQVRVANITWTNRGITKELRIIQKGELLERFRDSHGAYLPQDLADFRTFLELILHDGGAPAEKEKAARLIEHILPVEPERENCLNIARASASIVLLIAYICGPATLALNHWSAFEYWVLAAAYVLYLSEKSSSACSVSCRESFDLCELAAQNALDALSTECVARPNLVQGFPILEGHTYRTRVALLAGLLSARDLSVRIRGKTRDHVFVADSFLRSHLKEAQLWGESGVPYLFLAALEVERNCRTAAAEAVIVQVIRQVTALNGVSAEGKGLPSPYYSPEEAMRFNYGLDQFNLDQFVGHSYTVAAAIDFLARRWLRQTVASLWFGITRMALTSYVPGNPSEWFRWRSSDGVLSSTLPGEPQSWTALRTQAETVSLVGLPKTLVERPAFALWFVLVYPHRFTPATAMLIEDSLLKS